MNTPIVIPKGKAKKAAKTKNHETTLWLAIMHHLPIGSSGLTANCLSNNEFKVNGVVQTDRNYTVKVGDVIATSQYWIGGKEDAIYSVTLTAEMIEQTWG